MGYDDLRRVTPARYQHLSMTVFRAIEDRLHLGSTANRGISATKDPMGKIISCTSALKEQPWEAV